VDRDEKYKKKDKNKKIKKFRRRRVKWRDEEG
jgi:hypothetical protein